LNYLKANIPVSYAHSDRHKLFFVVYEFSVQCNKEGFCCGNPYKEEILLKVSLIGQSVTWYFISFEINIVSASGEILNKLSCKSRSKREHDIFSLKKIMMLGCVQKHVHENL
jgi:hypothetical protein